MILTEFQYYCSLLLDGADNSAKIFGVVKYAPTAYFSESSEWFVRADGTVANSGIVLKSGKSWLRVPQAIYSNRLTVQEGRDAQGITYRTTLSGAYIPHSSATLNELNQACRLPLIVHLTTASGEYVLGTPKNPVRLSYSFDNLEKYNFVWSYISTVPPRGFTDASAIIPPGGGIIGGIGQTFSVTQAQFNQLRNSATLQEGIYIITDLVPQQAWLSGGGNTAINVTYSPLRYIRGEITGSYATVEGITTSTAEELLRMQFYRGGSRIFIDEDFDILTNDVIQFHLPFQNETFRAFY